MKRDAEERRTKMLIARVSPAELSAMKSVARGRGVSLSKLVRLLVLMGDERTINRALSSGSEVEDKA